VKLIIKDWKNKYNITPILCETYVDPQHFTGACYKASNWHYIGQTKGFTPDKAQYKYHGKEKDIYVYPLKKNFRNELECTKCIYPLNPKKSHERERRLSMLLYDPSYAPELIDWNLLNETEIEKIGEKLLA
jgi:hypothetical protein